MTPDPRPTLGSLERDLEHAQSAYRAALDANDAQGSEQTGYTLSEASRRVTDLENAIRWGRYRVGG
jgi:hypothetical protein